MSMYLALLGAPGSGKGTQTELLSTELSGLFKFSTGDIIRSEIRNNTDLGQAVSSFLTQGKLVPDEVIIKLFEKTITDDVLLSGIVSDGFPRTKNQALSFLKKFSNQKYPLIVLSFDIELDQLMNRLLGRRICSSCNAVYHTLTKPPKVENICNSCGGSLIVRADDNYESIKVRFNEYQNEIQPIKDVLAPYIVSVDASRDTLDVLNSVKSVLSPYFKSA